MIKWELRERYFEQAKKFEELKQRYDAKIREAEEAVRQAKQEYEAVLEQEFAAGQDMSKQKQAALKAVEDAEKRLEFARQERRKLDNYINSNAYGLITSRDLFDDWQNNIQPQITEKEVKPAIERLRKAIEEYYNAMLDVLEIEEKYKEYYDFVYKFLGELNTYPRKIISVDVPKVSQVEFNNIVQRGQWPAGMSRKPLKGGER